MASRVERVEFEGATGATLAGRLHLPVGAPRATVLFAHCFTCGKDLRAAVRIADALAERGLATLRFDFTGLGQSGGDFADTDFSSNTADLVLAAGFLEAWGQAPALLVGHSLGGAAVLAAAEQVPSARGVVTLGAPADPVHVRHLIDDQAPDLAERGVAQVKLGPRTFTVRKQFLEDLEGQRMRERIGALGKALLVMHAPLDDVVGVDNAREIFVAAKHPKSFLSLDGADHLLTRGKDAAYVGEMISAWATRLLDELEEPRPVDAEEGEVVVRGREGFLQQVVANGHRLRADEPVSVGGTARGPTPYGLLLAGLGACTSMTLRMYADRKGWPLEEVEVRLSHSKVHAKDCEDCETEAGKVDQIERSVRIVGDLDDAQRARLMEIADKCPVHRTLHSEVKVRTREG